MPYLLVFVVLFPIFGRGGDELQLRTKSGVQSRYIGKQGLMLFDGPVTINEVIVQKGSWYVGVWNSTALASKKHGKFGNETDFTIGYRKQIGSTNSIWFPTVDCSLSYFVLCDWSTANDDRPIADLRLEFSRIPYVQPYVAFRYFGSLSHVTEDGWFFWVGLKRDQPLGVKLFSRELRLNIDSCLAFSTEDSFGREGGFIFGRVHASLQIPLTKRFALNPFCMVQVPSGDQRGGKEDFTDGIRHVLGGFVTVKF
ncbi:MAG: hypothetical protein WCT02_00320 [Candidatus Paceibacterota bacterium]